MKTIVVGTDFSPAATNAVNYAVELAKYFNARLILVNSYALPFSGYDVMMPLDMLPTLEEASMKSLKETRDRIIHEHYDFGIDYVSETGTPYNVIRNTADKCGADLVVTGIVGEAGKLKEHFIGSTATDLARNLQYPLFIIPQDVTYHRIHTICFACDMFITAESTLLYTARYFSSAFDAQLEMVSVKKSGPDIVWEKPETYRLIEKRLEHVKHKNIYIKDDNTLDALNYYFKFHACDLIMVNPKEHSFFHRLFNESTTKYLAFRVNVPLLVIH